MTSHLQPLDAGVIAAVKMRYKKSHLERAVDLADLNAKDIYKIDIMTAMKRLCAVWDEIGSVAIQNCWQTTGIVSALEPSTDGEGKTMLSEPEVEQSINEMGAMIVPPSRRISISMLLNCDNDLACTATPTNENTVDAIIAIVASNDCGDGSGDADNSQYTPSGMEGIGSVAELLSPVAHVKRFLMASNKPQHFLITQLHGLQKTLRGQCLRSMVQTSSTQFFQ